MKRIQFKRHIRCRQLVRRRRRRDLKLFPKYPNCKNCGALLQGMYCHQCGQYALDNKQSFWKQIMEYVSNAYQYDGRLPATLRYLFTRPGFLSSEFERGRINSYMHPVKLYMFLNILFFTFVIALVPAFQDDFIRKQVAKYEQERSLHDSSEVDDKLKDIVDTTLLEDTKPPSKAWTDGVIDGWFGSDDQVSKQQVSDLFALIQSMITRYLPLILIVLIPLYAAILRVLYRKRKVQYMTCLAFTMHIQAMMILLVSMVVLLALVSPYTWLNKIVYAIFAIYYFIYLIVAAHQTFKERWWKSFIKAPLSFLLFWFLCIIVFTTALVKEVINFANLIE